MNKEEVIERLCILATTADEQAFKNEHGHDCFCSNTDPHSFDEEVLDFIETVLLKEIDKQ